MPGSLITSLDPYAPPRTFRQPAEYVRRGFCFVLYFSENMPKRLVINADDFGFSDGVNMAVKEGCEKGVILSASIMATGDKFEEAVKIAKENPGLGVVVHLNIYRGTPLLERGKVKSLVGEDRKFFGKIQRIAPRLLFGKIKLMEVEKEWRAQIEKVIGAGIKPTHLDSDKHLHLWPSLFEVAARLAKEYDIKFIRLVREPFSWNPLAIALNLLSGYNARVALKYGLETAVKGGLNKPIRDTT